ALRARSYRAYGTLADGLEAVELYRAGASGDSALACDSAFELALLEGEMKADPTGEYRALYALRGKYRGAPCARRVEPVLVTLAAFAPPADELAKLDAKAPAPAGAASAGDVVAPLVPEATPAEPAKITGVERYGGKDASRVVVLVTRPTLFEVGSLAEDGTHGPRLFVDIKNTTFHGART